jgi:CheY-like chemotaxis protein
MKPLQDVHILVVEDDEDAREMIGAALEARGAAATCVAGAREALEEIQRSAPAVVISDINMPGEDGHAFLRKVRALPRDRGGRIPAVALTAMTSRADRIASRQAGFHYHLDKPVDLDKLVEIVLSLARLRQ